MIHHLKTVQPYYDASESGVKTFEIRFNDRNYQVGDILHLYEWDGTNATGREHYKTVTYCLSDKPFVPDGYICMGAEPLDRRPEQWVKVSERVPEIGKWVLGLRNGRAMHFVKLAGDGSWDKRAAKCPNVTHWMPLPEAPKEE